MAFNYADVIPKGKIVPMYLGDDGNVYTIRFHSMEEIDLIGQLVAGMLNHTVAIDVKNPVNDPKAGKIVIYDTTKEKS